MADTQAAALLALLHDFTDDGKHTTPQPKRSREEWLLRRIAALEQLLVCYRLQRPPSERLHTELERTRRAIPDFYTYKGADRG